MATPKFSQKLPPLGTSPDLLGQVRRMIVSINRIIEGRTENHKHFTLDLNAASTTVSHDYVSEANCVVLQATNAAAASEVASTYVSAVNNGSFVVTHPNNATTRTLSAIWVG